MTTETILTDDQIDHIIEDVAWPNEEVFNFGREVSRAIEQAVLAKLAEQEPVAWVSSESFSSDGTSDIMNKNLKIGTKLYAYPIPCVSPTIHKNDCVSEIAESETQPTAWLNEETGDVISSELKDDAPKMLKGYDVPLYKCPVPNRQVNLDSSNHVADAGEMETESKE